MGSMTLTRIRLLGRYVNPATGRAVNIRKGHRRERSTDHYFYTVRGRRVFVGDADLHTSWTRVEPSLTP